MRDGDAEVVPGLRVIPTPGHTPGHQSLTQRA
jgi:N-acyl homoserine lactone hydrolase